MFNESLLHAYGLVSDQMSHIIKAPLIFLLTPQLCYLYAELYKQTSSKETRRILMDTFFIDKTAVRDLTTVSNCLALDDVIPD